MLFYPLYSLAFCKAWYVRCVSTIIRYLMQWLLSKPVINFQIMNCPLPVCFICHHDWLMGHRLSSNFFLMSTLRHLKNQRQRNFTVWIIPKIDKNSVSTRQIWSAQPSQHPEWGNKMGPPWNKNCVVFLFWNIAGGVKGGSPIPLNV